MKTTAITSLILFASVLAFSQTEKRLALVIGNSEYQHGGALKNPVNDARSMAATLTSLGFEVMKYENATQSSIKQAINAFGIKLKGYDVGLFYYAGHGIQSKGYNYMIPIDAMLQAEEQVEFDCVAADRVLAFMESASTKVNVVIMDACRNNPFERSWRRSVNGSGLAVMNAPNGSLIAYATSPGNVASDGDADNGLYTSALLKHIKDPGLTIEQVFKRVRTEVSQRSQNAQVPWETTSLTGGDFYFSNSHSQSASQVVEAPVIKSEASSAARTNVSEGDRQKALLYYRSANAKYEAKQYEEAIADYSSAIEKNPQYADAHLWRGHCYWYLNNYEQAIKDYGKTYDLKPEEIEAYYWKGYALYNLTKYIDAIDEFDRAFAIDPQHDGSLYMKANCYYMIKAYDEAIAGYTAALAINPSRNDAKYWRGVSMYNQGEYAASKPDFFHCVEANYEMAGSYYFLASCTYMEPDYAEAVRLYTKALEHKRDYAAAAFWRGKSYHLLGDVKNARKDVMLAIQFAPNDQSYKDFLAEID